MDDLSLRDFMRARQMSEEDITKLEEEKIDCSVIMLMKDEELTKYIPKYGDRIAVVAFCRRQAKVGQEPQETKHSALMERLKGKLHSRADKLSNNKNAVLEQRRVELGWLDFDYNSRQYKQVRSPMGGGTYPIKVDKDTTICTLMEQAKTLFFPKGKNKKGSIEEFLCMESLVDYNQEEYDPTHTVAQLYEKTTRKILRLYLCTKRILQTSSSDEDSMPETKAVDDSIPAMKRPKKRKVLILAPPNQQLEGPSTSQSTVTPQVGLPTGTPTITFNPNTFVDETPDETLPPGICFTVVNGSCELLQDVVMTCESDAPATSHGDTNGVQLQVNQCLGASVAGEATRADTNDENERSPENLKLLLQSIGRTIKKGQVSRFNINRDAVWESALRGFRRTSYIATNEMVVRFSDESGRSEEGIDNGGPRREFLRLLMKSIKDSCLFTGQENSKMLTLDSRALREGEYCIAGRAMAVSLVHGGPAPCFLSPTLYQALCCTDQDIDSNTVTVDDIADAEIKEQVQKVLSASTGEELRIALSASETLIDLAGCCRPVDLTNKDLLVHDLVVWITKIRLRPALESFKEGLNTLCMLDVIKTKPQLMELAFTSAGEVHLTPRDLENMFIRSFSPEGSIRRATERRVNGYFMDFLEDMQDGAANLPTASELLVFSTGAAEVPPLGFDIHPSMGFMHDKELGEHGEFVSPYPVASTCTNHMKLPTIHMNYETFKQHMATGIASATGFGLY